MTAADGYIGWGVLVVVVFVVGVVVVGRGLVVLTTVAAPSLCPTLRVVAAVVVAAVVCGRRPDSIVPGIARVRASVLSDPYLSLYGFGSEGGGPGGGNRARGFSACFFFLFFSSNPFSSREVEGLAERESEKGTIRRARLVLLRSRLPKSS